MALNLDRIPETPPEGAETVYDDSYTCIPIVRNKRWSIQLASPKSGSTLLQQMLHAHADVYFGRERLLDFYRRCRVEAEGHCGWSRTQQELERVFSQYEEEPRAKVVGFKIQYDHVPPALWPQFFQWLECNQVSVIHLTRAAVVESFWTLQAEVLDNVQLGGEKANRLQIGNAGGPAAEERLAKSLSSNRQAISLDPTTAASYVRAVERQRDAYRAGILFGSFHIPYIEVQYEKLIDSMFPNVAKAEWKSICGFLDIRVRESRSNTVKVHPGGCKSKIQNWQEVRKALEGTTTAVACDGQARQSAQRSYT